MIWKMTGQRWGSHWKRKEKIENKEETIITELEVDPAEKEYGP